MTTEHMDSFVLCSCGDAYPAGSYDAGFIHGAGMCQNCDAAMPPKDVVPPKTFLDEVKQLCKDFSDRHDRPYMGDVYASLDALYEHLLECPEIAGEMSAAQELAGTKAILASVVEALKGLTMHARTTGGVAGADAGLMEACKRAEKALSFSGIGAAFMRGCDEQEVANG